MKITYQIYLSILIVLCSTMVIAQTKVASTGTTLADCAYLTKDHNNNPVLCWVEGEKEDAILHYSVSTGKEISFENTQTISTTIGLTAHHESMPKLAFKNDGTIVAVFQKRTPTAKNRFAGAIYYTQSFDQGKHWTTPNYLHTDTSNGIGRSFFDLTTLPDGEIGAVWLDGRKKQRDGSTLIFAKTLGKKGFQKDMEIAQKTCQCCRTAIYVDNNKHINIAFRDIINDSIRDISYLVSKDLGKTFSKPVRISPDNWLINGCPHTGPTMTENKNGLQFFWFTQGNGEGVYHTTKNENLTFAKRKSINTHARHPQTTTSNNGVVILVWDENFKTNTTYVNRIGVLGSNNDRIYITPDTVDADHPVVLALANGKSLVAWSQINGNKAEVAYSVLVIK